MEENKITDEIKNAFKLNDIEEAFGRIFELLSKEIIFESCGVIIKLELKRENIISFREGGLKTNCGYEIIPEEVKEILQDKNEINNCNTEDIKKNKKCRDIFIRKVYIDDSNNILIWVKKDKFASYFLEDEIKLIKKVMDITKLYIEDFCFIDKKEREIGFNDRLMVISSSMIEVVNKAKHFSKYDIPVLLVGETGTGKEEIAKLIHYRSKRANYPFVTVNCGAIPESLFESELFGHKKGAFTNAFYDRIGLLKEAGEGTIFFDEIGDLSLVNQVKLLRVIENKEYRMVGENAIEKVRARFIFATNKDLEEMIIKKLFRQDLYYRICAAMILIPPLRMRGDESIEMFKYFIDKFAKEYNMGRLKVDKEILDFVKDYSWPGNVRELISLARQLILWHSKDSVISEKDLPKWIKRANKSQMNFMLPLQEARDNFTREYVVNVLKKCNYNKSKACSLLRISRWGLHKLLMRLNIEENISNEKEDDLLEAFVSVPT